MTNDTGIMHIAAAYQKKIISFLGVYQAEYWFCTLIVKEKSKMLLSKKSNYPCSKHGSIAGMAVLGVLKTFIYKKSQGLLWKWVSLRSYFQISPKKSLISSSASIRRFPRAAHTR